MSFKKGMVIPDYLGVPCAKDILGSARPCAFLS